MNYIKGLDKEVAIIDELVIRQMFAEPITNEKLLHEINKFVGKVKTFL